MSGSPFVQAAGPSYYLADRKAAIQRAVNCYPEKLDGDRWRMVGTPGTVELVALADETRGAEVADGRMFFVVGSTLYEVATDGTATDRGTLSTGSGRVGMASNRTQLCIVDGSNLYVFTFSTNTLTTVSSTAWLGSNEVVEIDGYFVFVDPGTDQFYLSAIDDGTSLDALDFSSADSGPDDIVTHKASHRQLWLFGEQTTEIWINSGGADFPFARYGSYTLDVGCVGQWAACNAADTVVWIGKTKRGQGIVYMANGNQPQRISTVAVEQALAESTDLSAATMWAYQVEGHEFIGINAPGVDTTWVYDAAVDQWHERGEWNAGWDQLRCSHVVSFGGEHYAGDEFGEIVRFDTSTYDLNGRVLVRERTWPHLVHPSMEPVSYRGLELSATTGYGGSITLEISNDGGYNFGPPLQRSLGATGRWLQRVRWNALGSARNRVFRLRQSSAVPFGINGAVVDHG